VNFKGIAFEGGRVGNKTTSKQGEKRGGNKKQPKILFTPAIVLKSLEMTVSDELHLRHLTLDEALPRLDKYLNDAFMAGLYRVRIIHGKGTGTLRQAVRKKLDKDPLVSSYRPAGYGEGGAGVTIVELAEK
jgi:DNA mismatch repair protein MutS2